MTSCNSSVSIAVNQSPNSDASRSKSCDSVCTTNSSCYLQRRKAKNPLMYPIRPTYSKSSSNITNTVRQRVLSAKLLKLRSIQSQLNDANFHLSELSKENQILKNLQKRQDKALTKFENTSADLPRLIRSHEEQLRTATEKNKAQRLKIKELTDLLKLRDEELSKTQDKLTRLDKLSKDKRLLEREKLLEQIEDLKMKLQGADELNSMLNRKLALETKTAKQRLNNESMKLRQSQKELQHAVSEIDRLTRIIETRENTVHPRQKRFNRLPNGQSTSMITLDSSFHQSLKLRNVESRDKLTVIANSDSDDVKSPITNIKLEPIKCPKTEDVFRKTNDMLTLPSESIKNRLSSGSKSRESGESENGSEVSLGAFETSGGEEKNRSGDTSGSDYRTRSDDMSGSDYRTRSGDRSRLDYRTKSSDRNRSEYRFRSVEREGGEMHSEDEQFEKLNAHLDAAIKKAVDNVDTEFEKKMGDLSSNVMTNIKKCSDRLEAQKESFNLYQKDTDRILETFTKTGKLENKLKKSFMNFDPLNDDFFKEILSDDYKINNNKDKNGNLRKEDKFGVVDRKKLLNTLKAIDAGDSIESIDEIPTHNTHKFREVDELIG